MSDSASGGWREVYHSLGVRCPDSDEQTGRCPLVEAVEHAEIQVSE